MLRRELLLGLATLAGGCGPRRLSPPPAAPRVVSAAELIPPDLDVIVRMDLARMKTALGGLTAQALSREVLSREVLSRAAPKDSEDADPFVVDSLLAADVVYLGYRPSPLLLPLDRVLALQGHFPPLTKAPPGFSGLVDLGADVRYWDRRPETEPQRSATFRIYAVGERVRAFVSEAELDAVERSLSGLAGPPPLAAPEEGALSLAARPRLLGKLAGSTLRQLLEDSKTLELVVDLEADTASLRVALVTGSPEQASALASAGQRALERALGERAGHTELRAVAERVLLSIKLSRQELAPLVACLGAPSASAGECSW